MPTIAKLIAERIYICQTIYSESVDRLVISALNQSDFIVTKDFNRTITIVAYITKTDSKPKQILSPRLFGNREI